MLSGLKGKRGFTLVEIMIVVAIIGILAAIAIPNFMRARIRAQENACVANMKQIQGAVVVAQLDGESQPGVADLWPDYLHRVPVCPLRFDGTDAYVVVYDAGTGTFTVQCPNDGDDHDVDSKLL